MNLLMVNFLRSLTHTHLGCLDSEPGETEIFINDMSSSNAAAAAALNFSFSRVDPQMRKKTRPLKLKKKLYEFYAAPITKYYSHCVSKSDTYIHHSHSVTSDAHRSLASIPLG